MLSVDVLRGLVMFAMVFVNDVAGAKGLPWWLGHYPANKSGMTFVDVVFPAFLFVVGMSIPLAIEGRRSKGESWGRIVGHVFLRTLTLLAIGVLMVEGPDDAKIGWRPGLWKTLMYAGVIGACHLVRTTRPAAHYVSIGVRVACGLLLLYLAVVFRNKAGGYIQPKWWGILGLIGWAYLWATVAYLLLRSEGFAPLVGAVAVLMCVYIADRAGAFRAFQEFEFRAFGHAHTPGRWVNIGAHWGSQSAITMAGVVVGWMLLPENADARPAARMRFTAVFAGLMVLAGALLYAAYGINKNAATPTWCLFSAAITAVLWIGLYALLDAGGQRAWAAPLAWAGASALLVYILAGLWYAVVSLFGLKWYGEMGAKYPEALGRAWVAAVALTILGGGLGRLGFRLRV